MHLMGEPNSYDWSKNIVFGEECPPENQRILTLVLDDMARDPAGRKILERLGDYRIYLASVDGADSAFQRLGSIYAQNPNADEKTLCEYDVVAALVREMAENGGVEGLVNVDFEENRSLFVIDEETGELHPRSINFALAHELEHAGNAFEGHEATIKRLQNMRAQDENTYHMELDKRLSGKETPAEEEAIRREVAKQFPDAYIEYQKLQKLQKDIDQLEAKIPAAGPEDEKDADKAANAYIKNEPPRLNYSFTKYFDTPVLDQVIYYQNGQYDAENVRNIVQQKLGNRYISRSELKALKVADQGEEEYTADVHAASERLLTHNIHYVDSSELGNLSPLERTAITNAGRAR